MEANKTDENCKKKKKKKEKKSHGGRKDSLLLVERFGMQGNDMQPETKDQTQTLDHLQGVCIWVARSTNWATRLHRKDILIRAERFSLTDFMSLNTLSKHKVFVE